VPTAEFGPRTLFLLGDSAEFSSLLKEAATPAFAHSKIMPLSHVADIAKLADGRSGDTMLAVCDPDAATLELTTAKSPGANGSFEGCVVIFKSAKVDVEKNGFESVSFEEWKPAIVSRVLRSAWEKHLLRQENARLRGDLLTFGSRIAHDLRTPLGGVLTTTEMLREVLADDAPANVPLTQPILDSTDGLVKLIERTSFFARATASEEPKKRLDMSGPFWSAFQRLEAVLLKAQSPFTYPSTWPMVEGHESWLEAIWRTLLTNAVQYAPAGSKIEAGWSPVEGGNRFWVRNEGTIAAARRSTLYHPFHRLHEPGAPRGLGLPMMRRLVEREGGWCGFEERSGGAIEFFFVLPDSSTAETR
jgi:K+-sensing histidine kinase KdpD